NRVAVDTDSRWNKALQISVWQPSDVVLFRAGHAAPLGQDDLDLLGPIARVARRIRGGISLRAIVGNDLAVLIDRRPPGSAAVPPTGIIDQRSGSATARIGPWVVGNAKLEVDPFLRAHSRKAFTVGTHQTIVT